MHQPGNPPALHVLNAQQAVKCGGPVDQIAPGIGSLSSASARPRKPLIFRCLEPRKKAGQNPFALRGWACGTMSTLLTGVGKMTKSVTIAARVDADLDGQL